LLVAPCEHLASVIEVAEIESDLSVSRQLGLEFELPRETYHGLSDNAKIGGACNDLRMSLYLHPHGPVNE